MKLDSEPVVNARAERVEGWQKYYEYFHLLDADMQVFILLSQNRIGIRGKDRAFTGCHTAQNGFDVCFFSLPAENFVRKQATIWL